MKVQVGTEYGFLLVVKREVLTAGCRVLVQCRCKKRFWTKESRLNKAKTCGGMVCRRKYRGVNVLDDQYSVNDDGYVVRYENGKEVFQHREVMEQFLGRPLRREEIVHHVNGVKSDNRLDNLEIHDRSTHGKEHAAIFRELLALRKEVRMLRSVIEKLGRDNG